MGSAQESVRNPGFIGFSCLATVGADQVSMALEVSRRQCLRPFDMLQESIGVTS